MDRQNVTRELGQPGARELLESATIARLAYNGPDGLPRVIPIAFYWNSERIVVCTATTSPKVQALSARPNVAITIDVGDTPAAAKSLLVRGFAHLETVDGVADEYLEAAKKALDPDTHAASKAGRCTNSRCASRDRTTMGAASTTSAPTAYPPGPDRAGGQHVAARRRQCVWQVSAIPRSPRSRWLPGSSSLGGVCRQRGRTLKGPGRSRCGPAVHG
jgi:nitroimidazol reductase NimA-like FMN-containing flavoprotein (pyridoxamine 5'-phosphate oxidase superfamily)